VIRYMNLLHSPAHTLCSARHASLTFLTSVTNMITTESDRKQEDAASTINQSINHRDKKPTLLLAY